MYRIANATMVLCNPMGAYYRVVAFQLNGYYPDGWA